MINCSEKARKVRVEGMFLYAFAAKMWAVIPSSTNFASGKFHKIYDDIKGILKKNSESRCCSCAS